jgi:hypothetical protein
MRASIRATICAGTSGSFSCRIMRLRTSSGMKAVGLDEGDQPRAAFGVEGDRRRRLGLCLPVRVAAERVHADALAQNRRPCRHDLPSGQLRRNADQDIIALTAHQRDLGRLQTVLVAQHQHAAVGPERRRGQARDTGQGRFLHLDAHEVADAEAARILDPGKEDAPRLPFTHRAGFARQHRLGREVQAEDVQDHAHRRPGQRAILTDETGILRRRDAEGDLQRRIVDQLRQALVSADQSARGGIDLGQDTVEGRDEGGLGQLPFGLRQGDARPFQCRSRRRSSGLRPALRPAPRQNRLFGGGRGEFGLLDGGGTSDTALQEVGLPAEGACPQLRLPTCGGDILDRQTVGALRLRQLVLGIAQVGARRGKGRLRIRRVDPQQDVTR